MSHPYIPAAKREPLCIDLFAGLGGWSQAFLDCGYRCVGFDIERHDYGTGGYPGQLVLQDVLTLHGAQFRDAAVIVASPPCQAYSYRAMPWKRVRELPPPDNSLFDACFRIQREACDEAGRHIPLIVENVRGAQKWVGRAKWHFGSFYLWGDVPALMPFQRAAIKVPSVAGRSPAPGNGVRFTSRDCGMEGTKGFAARFEDTPWAWEGSRSPARKAASAQIAKIPYPLAHWIAEVYKPQFDRREMSRLIYRRDGAA